MSKTVSASIRGSRRWTAVEARAALAALKSSGLSARAFARREGLDAQRLRAWARRLEVPNAVAASPTFIEVARRTVETIEVVLPSGVVLRVAETVDPSSLRRIVEAVEGAAPC